MEERKREKNIVNLFFRCFKMEIKVININNIGGPSRSTIQFVAFLSYMPLSVIVTTLGLTPSATTISLFSSSSILSLRSQNRRVCPITMLDKKTRNNQANTWSREGIVAPDRIWYRIGVRLGLITARVRTIKNLSCYAKSSITDLLADSNKLNSAIRNVILPRNYDIFISCFLKFTRFDTIENNCLMSLYKVVWPNFISQHKFYTFYISNKVESQSFITINYITKHRS